MLLDYTGHLIAAAVIVVGWLSSRNLETRIAGELADSYEPTSIPALADIGNLSAVWVRRGALAELAPSGAVFAVAAKAFSEGQGVGGMVLLVTAIVGWAALLRLSSGSLLAADQPVELRPTGWKVGRGSFWAVVELLVVCAAALGTWSLTL